MKTFNNESANGEFLTMAVIAVVVVFVMLMFFGCYTVVPAGNVGVTDTFGVVDDAVLQPGMHLKWPWTSVIMFSTQTQKYLDEGTPGERDVATISAISNEGLTISMGIAVMYHIDPAYAPKLYKTVGPSYPSVLMKNPIHAVPRDIISRHDVKSLYSAVTSNSEDRAQIEGNLYDGITKGLLDENGKTRGVIIENVYLREIVLPPTLTSAIESKLKMEQQISEKQFEVQKQEMESNRMRAEAKGIADANKIIANSLTQSYLEWYSIEMMKSHTGATYFIPVGSDGRYTPNPVMPISGTGVESNFAMPTMQPLTNMSALNK